MIRRALALLALVFGLSLGLSSTEAEAQQPMYQTWNQSYSTQDWNRFYHYPYVYYPQNYYGYDYYRSNGDMYHRYVPEMRIPVYNRQWQNYYPQPRRYHRGHHFVLDVF